MNNKRKLSKIGALIIIAAMLLKLLPAMTFAGTGETYVDKYGNIFIYTDNGDGTATIMAFETGGSTDVVIPGSFDDLAVTAIGDNAFSEKGLSGVTIPDSVISIGSGAFSSNDLSFVNIPESVISLGASSFENNYLLTDVTIENSEAVIGESAFSGHDVDLTIHGYVDSTAIGYALENTHFLAVLGGIKLTDDNGNTYTYIENEEGKATVISFKPEATKDIEMPTSINGLSITDIYHFAFAKCGLESVIVPADVVNIGIAAFAFNQLTDVTIEGSSTNIGEAAFYENPEGLTIYGVMGSSAETYAEENEFAFITLVSKEDSARFAAGSGNGTSEKRALLVETPEQLGNVHNYPDKYFKLVGNIEMTEYLAEGGDGYNEGAGWEPICSLNAEDFEPFSGVFDGNGYTISGLSINRPGEDVQGLFGAVNAGAIIKNVRLKNINVIGRSNIGGLAGGSAGTITGCHVTGSVIGSSYVGGLVGKNMKGLSSIITGSSATGNVEGEADTGGLVGRNETDAMINKCKASVSVKGSVANTGGLTGYNKGAILNSYSDSSVVGLSVTGGLIGFNSETVEYSYAAGSVTGDTDAGGLVGSSFGVITSSYYDNDIAGVEYNGMGTPKATSEMKQQATFEDWEFESIWAVREGIAYPYLRWEAAPVSPIYTVTYDSNQGSGTVPADNNSYEEGDTVTVLGYADGLVRTGFAFSGWNTKSDGTGTNYTEGITFLMGAANTTLYAKWIAVSSSHDSAGGSYQASPSNNVPVTVGGQTQQQAAIGISQTRDGSTVTTVVLDSQKMSEIVNSSQTGSSVTIPITGKPDIAVGELNGQLVKAMENNQAILEIKTDDATYTLPAQQINIDAVSSQLGQTVNLSDIKVSIEIAKSSAEAVKVVEDSASKGNFSIVVPPIDFTVKCTYGDQTINISQFSSYVERTVAIPDGVDPQKITTGVVVEPDGTLRHVPTEIIVIDGKYHARINSPTNSTYSVIWNPVDFKDTAAHWAKEAINDMGSRMVIKGTGNDAFEPDKEITRAEFASIIVRALGLRPGTGKTPFTDVNAMDWYNGYIMTAAEYKIISGYGNGKFGPNDKITREQAMVIINRAMNITGLKVEFVSGEVEKLLEGYKDAHGFADYARNSIAACIKAQIVTGKNSKMIAPKDNITRAEVAVIIQRLLQKSNLI